MTQTWAANLLTTGWVECLTLQTTSFSQHFVHTSSARVHLKS